MILVAGGTGLLDRDVVGRLAGRGIPVRVLTRDVALGRHVLAPLGDRVELVAGDVRDPASLDPALVGVDLVVGAVQGFGGRAAGGMRAVDIDGNRNLIDAAAAAGVDRFVLLSIHNATATDPLALSRAKAAAEQVLAATPMHRTLVRPTAYMETWAEVVGDPIMESG
ncbi:MAG: NAD(P)H-binding protein [Chloroflexi bacterium]|nr:NAD(P)H-binding protein [Chloroflexota bacterium]